MTIVTLRDTKQCRIWLEVGERAKWLHLRMTLYKGPERGWVEEAHVEMRGYQVLKMAAAVLEAKLDATRAKQAKRDAKLGADLSDGGKGR